MEPPRAAWGGARASQHTRHACTHTKTQLDAAKRAPAQVGVVGALSAFYSSTSEVHDPAQQLRACMRLISKMPTLAALAYKTSRGAARVYVCGGGEVQGCGAECRAPGGC